jgi:ABC-type Fe3+/spermidine/putrescine transport system ATPase subunit
MAMNEGAETAVEVVQISKSYGPVMAVRSISLSVPGGEYFVLLGPSGGGKTTLLRLIGGFVRPSAGRVLLHGVDVSDLAPNERPTSMVFQGYALFPHMTVEGNVAYGLKLRKLPKAQITERVGRMLELVGLSGLGGRMPHELSGGQQQRVQLARSLVLESDILLLDEPLAALDAKLRKDMCLELKHIQATSCSSTNPWPRSTPSSAKTCASSSSASRSGSASPSSTSPTTRKRR